MLSKLEILYKNVGELETAFDHDRAKRGEERSSLPVSLRPIGSSSM
jgi:hypothetical protein